MPASTAATPAPTPAPILTSMFRLLDGGANAVYEGVSVRALVVVAVAVGRDELFVDKEEETLTVIRRPRSKRCELLAQHPE